MHQVDTTRAATDVAEFLTDLDGGQMEHLLSIALSETAAAVVDQDRKGVVKLELSFERIDGTHQVRVGHKVVYAKPTTTGKATEESNGATVLHVGRFGKLSLAQPSLLERERAQHQARVPGAE
jgi:hypothetical protein